MEKLKNKKVLILTTTDNMIWQFLIPHIKHMESLGATVECACAKTGFWFEELQKMGLILHEVKLARNPIHPKNLSGYKQLKKLFKEKQFNLIHCHQPVGGVMGRMLAKKFKVPCIYTAHGFHFFKGAPLKNRLIFKTIEKYCAKHTTSLVTINNEDFEACKNWKAKHKYKINGIGVDLSHYKADEGLNKAEFKESLGFNKNDFIVTSIGELNANKNTYQLFDVIKSIEDKKVKYLVVGQGPLKEQMEDFIKTNNLEDRIKMVGFRKDIQNILSVSNIYIMPSFREGLSRSMMEAMNFGLPVVASKIRGNTDLVGDNEGGMLCHPQDKEGFKNAILEIYNSKELQKQYKSRNIEFIKNFDINLVLKQMEEIYEETL